MIDNKPIVFAHRGFSGKAPENTLPAFTKALEVGVTGIELDVQLSKDGEVMVIHDEKIDRTTNGNGFLKEFTKDELKKLDAGNWFDSEYAGTTIPTLPEVLELIKNYPITLNIELKTGNCEYPGLEEKVLEYCRLYNMEDRVIYSSFNHNSLKHLKEIEPTAKIGVLYVLGINEPWEYSKDLDAEAIHPAVHNICPELIEGAHNAGMKVNTYTIDDEEQMKKVLAVGVDGIFTNYPDRLLRIIEKR